jgi:glycosyltransferase involved in cell wall biosynthesis
MLTQFYLPFLGGEELLVQNLSRELIARGHDVAVVTLEHPAAPPFEVDGGLRIYRLSGTMQRLPFLYSDTGRRFAPPFPDPELTWALKDILARERPDIVHAHNWLVHSFLPLKAWSGARLVLSLHDYSLQCARKDFMNGGAPCSGPAPAKCLRCCADHYGVAKGLPTLLSHRAMLYAAWASVDMFLPISGAVAAASGLVGGRLPYEVMPEFVADDVGVPAGDPEPWVSQLPAGDFLLFVGGLRRTKGIEVLLRAYAGLKAPPPLVFIGYTCPDPGGPIEFPPDVRVLRDWPNEAVMHAWRRCRFGLVPSIWAEPFGIVALEAMAAGRPIIASRIGGLADLVADGETGLLVPHGDAPALQGAMARLLRDAALGERMGQAARRRLDRYVARSVVPRFEAVYRQVSRRGGRRWSPPAPYADRPADRPAEVESMERQPG